MSITQDDKAHNEHSEVTVSGQLDGTVYMSQQKTTRFMILFSLYISLAGWIYNFDLGYGGVVLIMAPYKKDFGTCTSAPDASGALTETCVLSALQQSSISLTFLFIGIGSLLAGVTGNYLGRRGTIQVGCLIVALGAGGMLGTSENFAAYVACKCIGGIGLGHFITGAPSYGMECVAPNKRGVLTSLFNVGLVFGNAASIAVCLGSASYQSRLAWQIPIICQIPLSLILGVGVLLFPESPRWLLIKGEEEAARKSFAKFFELDPQGLEVSRQVREVQYYIEMERKKDSSENWTAIFRSPDLRRTSTSLLIVIGVAVTGGKFVSAYAAVFLADVGISNPYLINLIVASCCLVGSIPAPWIMDYCGRRLSLLIGYALLAVFMLIIASVGTRMGSASPVSQNIVIVFLCLWFFVFGASIGTSISTSAPKMHSLRLRTPGHAFASCAYEVFSFGAAFYTPYMLSSQYGNMGTNVGYFYFGLTTLFWLLIFAFVPETARLSLEQIDDYFMSGKKAYETSLTRNMELRKGAPSQSIPNVVDQGEKEEI